MTPALQYIFYMGSGQNFNLYPCLDACFSSKTVCFSYYLLNLEIERKAEKGVEKLIPCFSGK